jgi:hypothetical protein
MYSSFSMLMLACSGEGAPEAIQSAIRIGWASFAFTGFLLTVLLANRWYVAGRGFAAVVLGVIHPAWTVSATGGDCGGTKVMLSLLVGATAIISVVAVVLRSLSERAAEVSRLRLERPLKDIPTIGNPDNPYQSPPV